MSIYCNILRKVDFLIRNMTQVYLRNFTLIWSKINSMGHKSEMIKMRNYVKKKFWIQKLKNIHTFLKKYTNWVKLTEQN